ncbi:hypothetical protein PoB_002017700 [Plakobranchus ocellatus]|uniref:Uncharacterized protein n=1 Tax=Plakobranchus ocellatus TaxID=259542 RepID=A0AAV3ZGQ9_9GAST|nr:hypothetical protein PoB_002017700 [Plakobranchus ocellatus]
MLPARGSSLPNYTALPVCDPTAQERKTASSLFVQYACRKRSSAMAADWLNGCLSLSSVFTGAETAGRRVIGEEDADTSKETKFQAALQMLAQPDPRKIIHVPRNLSSKSVKAKKKLLAIQKTINVSLLGTADQRKKLAVFIRLSLALKVINSNNNSNSNNNNNNNDNKKNNNNIKFTWERWLTGRAVGYQVKRSEARIQVRAESIFHCSSVSTQQEMGSESKGGEESNGKLPHNVVRQEQSGPYSWFPDAWI